MYSTRPVSQSPDPDRRPAEITNGMLGAAYRDASEMFMGLAELSARASRVEIRQSRLESLFYRILDRLGMEVEE
jgi:hypothetical protein